jgi:hypothetical protein
MTPEQTVGKLFEIIMAMPDLSANAIYNAMQNAGIPYSSGHLAFSFTQNACGYAAIDGMGIKPCDEYFLLDADGNIVEEGQPSKNTYYVAASKLAQQYRQTDAFRYMAQTSSVLRAVDAALKQGSKPENLLMMPAFIFLKPATEAGMNNLNKVMSDYAAKLRERYPPKSNTSPQ